MGHRVALSGLCVCMALGCGGAPPPPKQRAPRERFVFAVIPKRMDNPEFRLARAGAEDKARRLGNVTVVWRGPKEDDVAEQVKVVQSMIKLDVAGIAISVAADTKAMRDELNRAVALDMAVVCFGSDCPDSLRHAYYGTNDLEGGRLCAEQLIKVMGKEGTVAILNGLRDVPDTKHREDGAREVLKKHPKIKVLPTYYCDGDVAKAVRIIRDTTQTMGDEITGWIFVGGWPLFSPNGLDCLKGRKTKVVSFDTLPEQWAFLENGQVDVLVGQQYYGWGAESVVLLKKIAEDIAQGHKVGKMVKYAGLDIVTKENLAKYKEQYFKWLPAASAKYGKKR